MPFDEMLFPRMTGGLGEPLLHLSSAAAWSVRSGGSLDHSREYRDRDRGMLWCYVQKYLPQCALVRGNCF